MPNPKAPKTGNGARPPIPRVKSPRRRNRILLALIIILVLGLLWPQHMTMPVEGANLRSFDQRSFWAYPWGKSVTHKGVDIFAKAGTVVHPSTGGLVLFCGNINMGGNVVYVLGPKWRLHYYAHLKEVKTSMFSIVNQSSVIGTVGATGNAAGKPPHLHYYIKTIFPYFWQADKSIQGWKKMFYVNPIPYLDAALAHA